jgi:hypothetical protein
MRRLLLTVEGAFDIPGIGAVLAPTLLMDAIEAPYPTEVILKRPDGSEAMTRSRFGSVHFNRPYRQRALENTWGVTCALPDLRAADIPPGTEVWNRDLD